MKTNNIKDDDRILTVVNILNATYGGLEFFLYAIPDLKRKFGEKKCPNVHNPFYNDTKPSFSVYKHQEKWYYKDFGNPAFQGDVFNFAALFYKLDLKKDFYLILQKINEDLKLGLSYDKSYHPYPSFEYTSKNNDGNNYKVYYKTEFSENDLKYWGQYGINEETLDDFDVKPVLKYILKKQDKDPYTFFSSEKNPIFAYQISEKCIKLYKPYDSKVKFQWIGEKPEDYCFGWKIVDSYCIIGKQIFITGGEKDVMTLHSLHYTAFCLNSETASISESILNTETFVFNQINILYDIDETGLKASLELCEKHSISDIYRVLLPQELIVAGGKDISDYVKLKFPLQELKDVLDGKKKFSEIEIKIPEVAPNEIKTSNIDDSSDDNSNEVDFPLIPDEVNDLLPPFLKDCCSLFDIKRERDIFLYSAIVLISGCLPKVYGYYDKRKIYSNLYLFIVAPAASSKSVAYWAKKLGMSLNRFFRQRYQEELRDYARELEEYNRSKKDSDSTNEKPEKPKRKAFFIPADASSASFTNLLDSNNGRGILFETEADTLGDTLLKDWGNYSTLLRNAYHHEQYTSARRTNDEFLDIEEPKLSVVVTGTPNQVIRLISDIENGLFSRFMFYCYKEKDIWKKVLSSEGYEEKDWFEKKFIGFGSLIHNFYFNLENSNHDIRFSLSPEQEEYFHKIFSKRLENFVANWGDDASATMKRIGVITFRLAMIFSILRLIDKSEFPEKIICSENDLNAALKISENLMDHASLVFNLFPKTSSMLKGFKEQKEIYFKALPEEFSRKEADKKANELNIRLKTAEKYLSDFVNEKRLIRIEYGKYKKVA